MATRSESAWYDEGETEARPSTIWKTTNDGQGKRVMRTTRAGTTDS